MREYDFAVSLGFSCAGTQSLRDAGLQSASFPFDWVGSPSLLASARTVANDFVGWFDRESLVLWDVRIVAGFISRVYKNVKTGFGFSHEFTNAEPIETHYAAVKEKYDRRIARFMERMRTAERVLVTYLESPVHPRASDADLVEARRILSAKFPQAEIDVLYMFEDPDCRAPEATTVAEGVTAVRMEYRTYLDGEVMHVCDMTMPREYLRSVAKVADAESAEDRKRFADAKRRELRRSLGRNAFDRWLNRKLKKVFRDLEAYLERQHLIPGDRPLWFDGSGK